MYLQEVALTGILLISYVISFQETEKNKNQLENEETIKPESKIKDYLKVEFPNTAFDAIYGNTENSAEISSSESLESMEDDTLTDMLNRDEIQDLRGLVSSIEELSVYNGVYHPYEYGNNGPHRRRKRASDALVQNLHDIVKHLENMVNDTISTKEKKKYYDLAVSSLDSYIQGVKDSVKTASNSTIQIMKLDNNLIVQCAGWLWYPISKLNKTITCSDGIMRFENRDKTLARGCNLYSCMDLAL